MGSAVSGPERARKYAVVVGGDLVEVELRAEGEAVRARVNGEYFSLQLRKKEGTLGVYMLTWDDRSVPLWIKGRGRQYRVLWRGRALSLTVEPLRVHKLRERFRGRGAAAERDVEEVRAVMPGLVVQVAVQEGQRVEPGDGLLVISAMKMENEIRAPRAGVIERVNVKEGQEVRKDELLCVIRPEGPHEEVR